MIGDVDGRVHILNTNTLQIENVLETKGVKEESKPILSAFSTQFGNCLVTLDAGLNLKIFRVIAST